MDKLTGLKTGGRLSFRRTPRPLHQEHRWNRRKFWPVAVNAWAISSAPDAIGGTSSVMAHNENPHDIANDTKQEMVGKALQIHAAQVMLADRERFRPEDRVSTHIIGP
jgi:hypothetical protein